MSRFETVPYNPALLQPFLYLGEGLLAEPPASVDSFFRFRSEFFPIRDQLGKEGDSVFLVMHEMGISEPVEVVGEATFKVRPVAGRGILLRRNVADGNTRGVEVQYMDADKPNSIDINWGEAYSYMNVGQEPFVVRDDAYPDFKDDYEVPAYDLSLLRRLASYGVEAVTELFAA